VRRQKDDFRASTILVDLDTEDIVLVGAVSGTVAAGKGKEKNTVDDEAGEGKAVP